MNPYYFMMMMAMQQNPKAFGGMMPQFGQNFHRGGRQNNYRQNNRGVHHQNRRNNYN